MYGDVRDDWRLGDIERKAEEAHRRIDCLESLRSDISHLQCSLREARSEIDGLRYELQANQERLERLEGEECIDCEKVLDAKTKKPV